MAIYENNQREIKEEYKSRITRKATLKFSKIQFRKHKIAKDRLTFHYNSSRVCKRSTLKTEYLLSPVPLHKPGVLGILLWEKPIRSGLEEQMYTRKKNKNQKTEGRTNRLGQGRAWWWWFRWRRSRQGKASCDSTPSWRRLATDRISSSWFYGLSLSLSRSDANGNCWEDGGSLYWAGQGIEVGLV